MLCIAKFGFTVKICLPTVSKCFVSDLMSPYLISRKDTYRLLSNAREWSNAIDEAEKVIGYPTSFLGLRCLLSDELSYVAMHLKKLAGTKHLLLKTAKKLFGSEKNNLQTRGLLVLLISKAAGLASSATIDLSENNKISERQRSLAEITEMIHTADLIHRGIIELKPDILDNGNLSNLQFGNKMAVLSGDYVLASASRALAQLYNAQVVDIMSSAILDISEAGFIRIQEEQCCGSIVKCKDQVTLWQHHTFLATSSLIAKSCQSAVLLAGLSLPTQQMAFQLGENIGYLQQLVEDMLCFSPDEDEDNTNVSSTSLPMLLASQFLVQGERSQHSNQQILAAIKESGAEEECHRLCRQYRDIALKSLNFFPVSDARIALDKIIRAISVEHNC